MRSGKNDDPTDQMHMLDSIRPLEYNKNKAIKEEDAVLPPKEEMPWTSMPPSSTKSTPDRPITPRNA
jgi:hypothetical protein